MAIVSFSRRFVFLKTRKTAGTSIQGLLKPDLSPPDIVSHRWENLLSKSPAPFEEFASRDQLNSIFPETASYFSFGFTRHPYEIVVSRFLYQIRRKRVTLKASKRNFNDWAKNIYFRGEPGFEHGRYVLDRSRHLLFDSKFHPTVEFIGRFERLEEDLDHVLNLLHLPTRKIPHLNRSRKFRRPAAEWIDSETSRLIEAHFDFELDYFQYKAVRPVNASRHFFGRNAGR